ncbi:RNA demethylase ALKBH10B-like isoform X2 [Oryza brachyantha]|uniref:RNA demethylase ALKBH10B-like isoform X2 n=1 Tax=Oryza brachyantha TaxID=4533 RepID=UPI001ADB326C|nr:RNA demethylase ALKBH10B-like isoform X2 [Oryza brachyantha]
MAAGTAAGWVVPDGRDGFVAWLRGEFAAANAIIDLLLDHLRGLAGDPAAAPVAAAVHRRRLQWPPVIHLQYYFPVNEVALALQHASARRPATAERDDGDVKEGKTLAEQTQNSQLHSHISRTTEAQPQKGLLVNSNVTTVPTGFVVNEVIDGRTVNVLEGLKLYKGFIDVGEIEKILSFANEAKTKRHEAVLEGQTVVVAKRPMKGHGREIIQLGLPITGGPPEDAQLRDVKVDPIPGVLQDLFDRLVHQKVVPSNPDYCVIDFFGEGDYSHPHHPPPWYGRPVCTLCLTDCDMVFGHVIAADSRGDHVGPLKLSLTTGSVLVFEGKSADIAKRALPATCKQRVLLSFGKSVSRKHVQPESSLLITPPLTPPPMPWGAPLRPGNIAIHPLSPTHLVYDPTNRAPTDSTPALHQIPSNSMHTVFLAPAPVIPKAVPFGSAVTLTNTGATWMAEAAPRPASPRLPFQGTGVFLPPGAGNPSPAQKLGVKHADAKPFFPQEPSASSGVSARVHKTNDSVCSKPTRDDDMIKPKPVSNGSSGGSSSVMHDKATGNTEEQNAVAK